MTAPRGGDVLALCYHAVRDRPVSRADVSAGALRAQLRLLVAGGYRGATFASALGQTVADLSTLSVTFDDADGSVLERALPVLAELGLHGTAFVPIDVVGRAGALGWADLEELAASGWEIGSHTCTHPVLTGLADRELHHELRASREQLEERLGRPCTSLAYPFGIADRRVVAAAVATGYTAACTVDGGRRGTSPLAWPRVGIDGGDGLVSFRAKTSPLVRRLRGSPLGRPANRALRSIRSRSAEKRQAAGPR